MLIKTFPSILLNSQQPSNEISEHIWSQFDIKGCENINYSVSEKLSSFG